MSGPSGILKALRPHVPMIKFRKGGRAVAQADPKVSAPIGSSARGTGIEEDLLPRRYARLALGEQEAELVMSGGAS